eukprot:451933_1
MAQFGGDQFVIVICTLTSIYTFILTPLSLYYLHLLWKLSSEHIPFFTKRHPKLILVSAILFNIYPTILRPIADLTRAYSIFPIDHPLPRSMVNIMQWYLILDYMRLWLLYYDYNYSLHSLKLKWKEHILKTEMNIPWTHKYKFMGNLKTLSIISIPIGIIFVLIIVGGEILFGAKVLLLLQVAPLICTLFALVIAVKVRKCRDEFMIQKEMQIYGIALILVILSYMTIQMVSTTGTNLRFILMNMFTCFCCYFMSFVSTHWVLKQYEKHLLEFKLFEETQNEVSVRLTLEEILSTKIGFDIFASHLVTEFSIENLFYIFEMVQIKNQLILHKLIEEKDVGIMFPIDFHRIDTLTRKDSYIYTFEEMKKNIEYIISQYIYMDAPYSINISSNMRNELKNSYCQLHNAKVDTIEVKQWEQIWDNETKANRVEKKSELIKKYMKIFDESMEEIIALMTHDSLTRFYSTKEYQAFVDK